MTCRLRQHVNPFKLELITGVSSAIALPQGRLIEVELGCADAQFLFQRAQVDPSRFYVGLEIREYYVNRVNLSAARSDMPVRAYFVNINADISHLFAPESVTRFFLNFPDPWFKRRHHKRRVLTATVADSLRRQLVLGGELFLQTDVFDVALDAMAVLETTALVNVRGPWGFTRENPFGARSRREDQSEGRNRRIWRLWYRRVSAR